MAGSTFTRRLIAQAPLDETWHVLTDVKRIASWVPIVEAFAEKERLARYSAVLKDQVGPFRLRADLEVLVTELREFAHAKLTASGEDRQVGSRIGVEIEVNLGELAAGATEVTFTGSYEVTGRIATLGVGTIRRKADKIIESFFASAGAALDVS